MTGHRAMGRPMNTKSRWTEEPGDVDGHEGRSEESEAKTEAKAWPVNADVRFQAIAGDVRRVPGSGTKQGDRAISAVVRDTLDRVRRSIRERSARQA